MENKINNKYQVSKIEDSLYGILKELYQNINYTKYKYEDSGEECYGYPKLVPTVWYGKIKYSAEFREKIEKAIKDYENYLESLLVVESFTIDPLTTEEIANLSEESIEYIKRIKKTRERKESKWQFQQC